MIEKGTSLHYDISNIVRGHIHRRHSHQLHCNDHSHCNWCAAVILPDTDTEFSCVEAGF